MIKNRIPVAHLTKRGYVKPAKAWLIRLASILAAVLIGGIIFLLLGKNPFVAFGTIIDGALGTNGRIRSTIKIAVPLLGTALAIAPCFKMKFWNIGAEGQITMGAIGACLLARTLGDTGMRSFWVLVSMAAAGLIFGAFWALIPAFFKAKWGTNETLFTLMLNYIALGIVKWLRGGPWEGKPGSQIVPDFNDSAALPSVFGVHAGWIIVLALVVFMFIYMNYTKHGYEISVIGESVNTARYAGMNVGWITVRTMLLSGAICGLVGFMIISGEMNTLPEDVARGAGFTAITVAWLSQLNPMVMVAISMFLAILDKGARQLQTVMAVPESMSEVITGIFLFAMLSCEFFINYKIVFNKRTEEATLK